MFFVRLGYTLVRFLVQYGFLLWFSLSHVKDLSMYSKTCFDSYQLPFAYYGHEIHQNCSCLHYRSVNCSTWHGLVQTSHYLPHKIETNLNWIKPDSTLSSADSGFGIQSVLLGS